MDVLTKWFQFSLGVEPNKATLQGVAQGFNDYISALAEGQKALAQYANSAKPEQFLSSTPLSNGEKQKLIEQYVSSPQGKQELESRLKKQEKAQRQPIIWQIPEEKMNELKWQRTQLLRRQREQAAKKNPQVANKPVQKVTQGPVKKVGGTRQPPKLGSSKASITSSKAPSIASKPSQAKKPLANGVPSKAPAKTPAAKAPPKAAPKVNGVAK
ncbi:MAG: hypothetical protein L6R40_006794 [Gallowayella cf. fulva]|nr:MAG: hypothetical protein L6R40_006794 [Xanthomendoza cf. fulva]